jgi:hypothetical protein
VVGFYQELMIVVIEQKKMVSSSCKIVRPQFQALVVSSDYGFIWAQDDGLIISVIAIVLVLL